MQRTKTFLAVALACAGAATVASASTAPGASDFEFTGELAAGYQYDSNVSVDEIDTATGQADTAWVTELAVAGTWTPTERFELSAGYDYLSYSYQDFDAFDLDLQILHGDISYRFDWFTLGLSRHDADADLGDSDFLVFNQSTLYASKLIDNHFFWRISAQQAEKRFTDLTVRDADTESYGADLFWFSDEGKSFITAGYTFDDEDATADAFDFHGHTWRVKLSKGFQLWNRDQTLELGWNFQQRDYQADMPGLGQAREDKRHVAELNWTIPVNDYLSVVAKAEYADFQSNDPGADYQETLGSVHFRFRF